MSAVRAISPATLSPTAALNREIVIYDLETNLLSWDKFKIDAVQQPYLISQQSGAYFSIPDFLNSSHPIENASDAEAYLSRLAPVCEAARLRHPGPDRAGSPRLPRAGWSLDLALGQMEALRKPAAADSGMVNSIVRRTEAKGIPGDWRARATKIVESRSIRRSTGRWPRSAAEPTTKPGDGATRLPRGDEIYAAALAQATTSSMTPDEVHQLGLSQVAEISAAARQRPQAGRLYAGTVGERLAALNNSPAQLYPNTDPGRAELIASLNANVKE